MPLVSRIRKRWRPTIAFVVAGVCVTLVSVPVLALLAVQRTSNQFIRETEQSLIQQSAIYAALYADMFQAAPGQPIGTLLNDTRKAFWADDFHPISARLNVRVDPVLDPRPDGTPVNTSLDPRHAMLVERLVPIARGATKTNLSGVAFLDHEGRLLNEPDAPSLAQVTEVQVALQGDVGRALRLRSNAFELHPLSSISRDTTFRVFVAYPVIAKDRVVGAIYMSRTPLDLGKFLYQERVDILTVFCAMFVAASVIGWVLTRLISRPTKGLRDAARVVADGQTDAAPVLRHYGLRELASLGESVEHMAATLTQRSKDITIYTDHVTHELKSPVTAIIGAAELLHGNNMPAPDRDTLLGNISDEAQRMNLLLSQLRDMTVMRAAPVGEPGRLDDMLPDLPGLQITIETSQSETVPLTVEHGRIILLHLAQNALAHNAANLRITWDGCRLTLADDGNGIDPRDLDRVLEPFFTTRRETGGTGMGLAICKTLLESYNATFKVRPSDRGATFDISFPA